MHNLEQRETIIFGGGFSPIHNGHMAIARGCVEYAHEHNADVWIMPSGDRSDKTMWETPERRIAGIKVMIAEVAMEGVTIDIITTELERSIQIETFDTFLELQDEYPDRTFTWVFGADSTMTMAEWYMGEWMLENLSMLVTERPGYTLNPIARHALTLAIPSLNISSTMVRERIAAGEPIEDLCGPGIAALYA